MKNGVKFQRPRLPKRLSEDELHALRVEAVRAGEEVSMFIAEIDSRSKKLRDEKGRERRRLADGSLDPRTQAGPHAIRKVHDAIERLGVATQVEIGRVSGVGSGTLTWAIKALELDGQIEPTGERVGRSAQFRRVPKSRRRRRVTRMDG